MPELRKCGEAMSDYIINDDWILEYERNIEELIGSDLEYDSATNPTPPLRKVDGTRWHELFGTPERAARTSWYMLMCKHVSCGECPILDGCDIATDIDCDDGEAALLEWLRGDAE